MTALLLSQVIFTLMHVPNRVAAGMWRAPADMLDDLAILWIHGAGIEWSLIPVAAYDELLTHIPAVEDDPAIAILMGRA